MTRLAFSIQGSMLLALGCATGNAGTGQVCPDPGVPASVSNAEESQPAIEVPPPKGHDLGYDDGPVKPGSRYRVHDSNQPRPPVVVPGTFSTESQPGLVPSDARVLFREDADLERNWVLQDGSAPVTWTAAGGVLTVGKQSLRTKDEFDDFQLHLEWMAPEPSKNEGLTGQGRGNSGLFLLDNFEVQILDSYRSDTYADGQAGAMYGQFPPMVNASRPPGRWQVYDIVFFAPRFDAAGKLVRPARLTVLHNGVLIHHNKAYFGPSTHRNVKVYDPKMVRGPLRLQDHNNPVRFRNIWIRPLSDDAYPGHEGIAVDAPVIPSEPLQVEKRR